jgi:hypothetical protein
MLNDNGNPLAGKTGMSQSHESPNRDARRSRSFVSLILAWIHANVALLVGLLCASGIVLLFARHAALEWLSDAKEQISALQNLVAVVAVIIGGAWALQRFIFTREAEWNVQVTVKPTFLPYDADSHLMVVDVFLKNVGKVRFRAGLRGIELEVDELVGNVDMGKPLNRSPVTKEGPIPMLEVNREHYDIEPGCEYHEVEAVLVPKNKLLAVSVTVFDNDELSVDGEVIIQSVAKSGQDSG